MELPRKGIDKSLGCCAFVGFLCVLSELLGQLLHLLADLDLPHFPEDFIGGVMCVDDLLLGLERGGDEWDLLTLPSESALESEHLPSSRQHTAGHLHERITEPLCQSLKLLGGRNGRWDACLGEVGGDVGGAFDSRCRREHRSS